jgi:hypothetical protein
MSGAFYKGLGFLVWKAGTRYLRRRYGAVPRRIGLGAGALALAAATAGGIALRAQRRCAHAD